MSLIQRPLSPKGNRQYIVITEPVLEPITVAELKVFARIDTTAEDDLLTGFIVAARQACEDYLGRALISKSIRMVMDYWPGRKIELPFAPLISITSVETVDESDVTTTYSSDNYYAVTEAIPGELVIKQGISIPSNTERDIAGYRIEYKAGYGLLATDVPSQIREALKLWATSIYENRSLTPEPPPEARTLLDLYRIVKL